MKFPEQFRIQQGKYTSETGDPFGLFHVPARRANGRTLRIIADDGSLTDWEHVSVSIPDRPDTCPSWPEMCLVKDLFWDAEDCVVQFHPPASQYINIDWPDQSDYEVRMYDIQGRMVGQWYSAGNQTLAVLLPGQAAGTYLLQLVSGNKITSRLLTIVN